jgi:hypothetical protein
MSNRLAALFSASLFLLAGCGVRPFSTGRASTPSIGVARARDIAFAAGLKVDVKLPSPAMEGPEDLRVLVSVGNQSGATIRMHGFAVDIAKVALAAQTMEGKPSPQGQFAATTSEEGDAGRILLAPGQSNRSDYAGRGVSAQPVGLGAYREETSARGSSQENGERGGKLEVAWLDFAAGSSPCPGAASLMGLLVSASGKGGQRRDGSPGCALNGPMGITASRPARQMALRSGGP